jgi:hypothetical protein
MVPTNPIVTACSHKRCPMHSEWYRQTCFGGLLGSASPSRLQGPMTGELSATDLSLTVARILKKGAVASSMPRRPFQHAETCATVAATTLGHWLAGPPLPYSLRASPHRVNKAQEWKARAVGWNPSPQFIPSSLPSSLTSPPALPACVKPASSPLTSRSIPPPLTPAP